MKTYRVYSNTEEFDTFVSHSPIHWFTNNTEAMNFQADGDCVVFYLWNGRLATALLSDGILIDENAR
jgi:hypothetical protein